MAQEIKPFSVLLIESEEPFLNRLKEQFLESIQHPAKLHVSKTFADALDKIGRNSYHVILAGMPVFNGEEVADILREMDRRKLSTPFILMVPPGEEAKAHRALKAGATDYVIRRADKLEGLAERLWGAYRNYELAHGRELEEEIQSQSRKLLEVNEKLRSLSIRDELTGLYNHRFLQERLAEEFIRAVRYRHPLSCLLIDLDLFHRINNTLGHVVGDEILKEAAGILLESSRLSDLIARFGGEEFAIILPHVDYQGARDLAERLRVLFAERTFLGDSHQITTTVSIGVASFPEDAVRDRNDLLNFSEQALHHSKTAGRNLITLYRQILPTIGETLPHLKISEERVIEFQRKLSDIADQARRGYLESSRALIRTLEGKDPATAGHAGRSAKLALQVAETMGLSLEESEVVEHAGLLHDIGKICISDEILLKPNRLTLPEYEAMKQHPYFGYRIVEPIRFLAKEATLILHHHEWFNGEGYPCRLGRNEIPLGARIVAVVDSYDTMCDAGGRYKETISVDRAVNELIACSGTQFDPEVVQAFIQVLLMRKELSADAYDRKNLQKKTLESQEKI